MIQNINDVWGDPVEFDSVAEMEKAILSCHFELPEGGLKEGRDYAVLQVVVESTESRDYPGKWVNRIYTQTQEGGKRTLRETVETLTRPEVLASASLQRLFTACAKWGGGVEENPIEFI